MPDETLKRYNELINMCWKLLKRGMIGMTSTANVEQFGNELRAEGQVIYERYRDLNPQRVIEIITTTLCMVYDAYDALPRPDREPEQMDIFSMAQGKA